MTKLSRNANILILAAILKIISEKANFQKTYIEGGVTAILLETAY